MTRDRKLHGRWLSQCRSVFATGVSLMEVEAAVRQAAKGFGASKALLEAWHRSEPSHPMFARQLLMGGSIQVVRQASEDAAPHTAKMDRVFARMNGRFIRMRLKAGIVG